MIRFVCEILPEVSRPVLTYGVNEDADYRAENIRQEGMCTRFTVKRPQGHEDLEISLKHAGPS